MKNFKELSRRITRKFSVQMEEIRAIFSSEMITDKDFLLSAKGNYEKLNLFISLTLLN